MAGSPEFLSNLGARLKNAAVQRVIGVVVLLAAVGAFVGVKYFSHPAQDDAAANQKIAVHANAPVQHSATQPVASAAPAPVAPAPTVVATPQANPKSVHNRLAATGGNGAPVVTAVPQSGPAATAAHLDEHVTYQYNALGRRDPFQSLVDGQFIGMDVGGDAPPDPGGIKVVGIVWGTSDQFAMVEDVRGNSFVLRKGDKVQNGFVESLKRDGVVVNITADGQSQSVVIPLVKGVSNAR